MTTPPASIIATERVRYEACCAGIAMESRARYLTLLVEQSAMARLYGGLPVLLGIIRNT
jgi:hypothetical protein